MTRFPSDPAAFKAEFVDLKLVKTRKVCQLTLELPIEQADKALEALGGLPRPDLSVWVAVALLSKKAAEEAGKPKKRHWHEIPLAEQAGIRCADPKFQDWLKSVYFGIWPECDNEKILNKEEATAKAVKTFCYVKSRSEITPEAKSGINWQQLDERYRKDMGLETEQR